MRPSVAALLVPAGVILQSLWLAQLYPAAHLDPDLLSYLSYYRDWRAGAATPFGYTVPKVLPVLLLGPLGSPRLALFASIAVAALGGVMVVLLAERVFGRLAGALAGLLYVLDPLRCVLTLRSSVDLYLGVALLAAMLALHSGAVLAAGFAILIAALAKPVAVACALAILVVPQASWRRRLVAAALPLLALPLTAVLNAMLAGLPALAGLASMAMPEQHRAFVRVAQAAAPSWSEGASVVVREWFGGLLFAHTWPLIALGAVLYAYLLRREPSPSRIPRLWIVLVPALLAAAYLVLAALEPLVLFTRFFWVLSAALSILAAAAVAAVARLPLARLPISPALRTGLAAALLLVLIGDRLADHRWRERLMLAPYEAYAGIAASGVAAIADDGRCAGPAVVPLAYLPLAAWRAPAKLHRGELCAAEDWADGRGCAAANCILVIPDAATTERARVAIAGLAARDLVLEVGDERGALVRTNQ